MNLRWSGTPPRVFFDVGYRQGVMYSGSEWSPYWINLTTPAQRATVEAFFAAGHPVERVTGVRWSEVGRYVEFSRAGCEYCYPPEWERHSLQGKLHPLDIALIERCWAEGRLGEREVLADDGTVCTVVQMRHGTFEARFGTGWDDACYLGHAAEIITDPRVLEDSWHRGTKRFNASQRARVRAIVAGMQKDLATRTGPEAQAVAAVVTEAHSVTPSGEVKAPELCKLCHGVGWSQLFGESRKPCLVCKGTTAPADVVHQGEEPGITPGHHWEKMPNGGETLVADTSVCRVCDECGGRCGLICLTCSEQYLSGDDLRFLATRQQEAHERALAAAIAGAPDLTELREAQRVRQEYIDAIPCNGRRPDILRRNEMQVLAAVERLVGK